MGKLMNPKKVLSKAVKFADKRETMPTANIHLDESGYVVATDSHRLFFAPGWDGPSIEVPIDLAKKMAKIPVRYTEVEVDVVGGAVECRYGGNVLKGDAPNGKYPNVQKHIGEPNAVASAELPAKQAAVICGQHEKVQVEIADGTAIISGTDDPEPAVRFEGADGAGIAWFNAEYLKSALEAFGDTAYLKIAGSTKPALVSCGGMGVVIMPVKMDSAAKAPKVKEGAKMAKKQESKKAAEVKVTKARITPTPEGVKAEVIEERTEKVGRNRKAAGSKVPAKKEAEPVDETAALKARIKELEKQLEAVGKQDIDAAATVSLTELCKAMQGWCSQHPNTCVTYIPKDGACVKVHGVLKEHDEWQKELLGKGFRFSSKKGFWYYGDKEAKAQGKVAVVA